MAGIYFLEEACQWFDIVLAQQVSNYVSIGSLFQLLSHFESLHVRQRIHYFLLTKDVVFLAVTVLRQVLRIVV
jgi:hypothetical protein